eukprot:2449242-Rhodomonas_salina.2
MFESLGRLKRVQETGLACDARDSQRLLRACWFQAWRVRSGSRARKRCGCCGGTKRRSSRSSRPLSTTPSSTGPPTKATTRCGPVLDDASEVGVEIAAGKC